MHPLKKSKNKTKRLYIATLEYFINDFLDENLKKSKLDMYKIALLGNDRNIEFENINIDKAVSYITCTDYASWREKYKYFLVCDIALLLVENEKINLAVENVRSRLSKRKNKNILEFLSILLDNKKMDNKYIKSSENLIEQYKNNNMFFQKNEKRIVFTATMSAGKSTIINALIGKKIARTSVEACTGNITYFKNKAFDDSRTCMITDLINLDVNDIELENFTWDKSPEIISYFNIIYDYKNKICLIDTPGVNSAINEKHKILSTNLMKSNDYDSLVYVFNANKLGTDEEFMHLKWISENVDKNKTIFVLNKLDTYRKNEDSIEETISKIKEDLANFGYDSPILCPLSAYVGLLEKMKISGLNLSEDEEDEYCFYSKKFKKKDYDFSEFYNTKMNSQELLNKSGLVGLENLLYEKGV